MARHRTPRFFLRRFKRGKRNPHYDVSYHTKSGGFGSKKVWHKKKGQAISIMERLRDSGLDVSNVTEVLAAAKRRSRRGRKAHRKAKKTRSRKAKKTSRAARRRFLRRQSKVIGRIFSRKVGKRRYSVKILGSRKGHGKKRKSRAVKWSGHFGKTIFRALSYGSRHKKGTHMIGFTNPRKRRARRSRRSRRNPGLAADYVGGLTSAPNKIMSIFKGPGAVKNVAFAAGGAVGTFMLGGILSAKVIKPLLEKVAPGFAVRVADPSTIEARVVGGLLPYTAAFGVCKLFGKKLGSDMCSALMIGGAVASVVELIRPGMVGDLLKKAGLGQLPYAGPALAGLGALSGPVCGLGYADVLAGYEVAPNYSGTGEYVEAPSYSGTNGIAGYVEAAGYQGSAGMGAEALAGTYLDDAAGNVLENNWL